ncbi:DUF5590 domain-containing protein [Paenibacillus aurantiacus]|uniref:DUF5590 domain-containing protein n=1 Tax=Paenibacillus aurantiacus TaxID=1936118 RepID=A0ABV5KYH3_9BACL
MRTVRRKRSPFWTPVRIALFSAVVLVTLLVGLNAYYMHVQGPRWEEENQAKWQAKQTAGLVSTKDAYKYVWDTTAWVVEGKDTDGDDAVVWLTGEKLDQFIVRKKKDSVIRAQLKEQFFQGKPDADLKQMQLGLLEGQPVWELFYARDQSGEQMYYYDFYRYNDGAYIITYNLPKK